MSVLPNYFALGDIKQATRSEQPGVAKISEASSGQIGSEYQQAGQQRAPTEIEKKLARELAEAGITGPPPAFQISVLEAQSDIRYVIKQMEKAHEQAAIEEAVLPTAAQVVGDTAPSPTKT